MYFFFKTKGMKSSVEEIKEILTRQNQISIENDAINEQQAKKVMSQILVIYNSREVLFQLSSFLCYNR